MSCAVPNLPLSSLRAGSADAQGAISSAFGTAQSPGILLVTGIDPPPAPARRALFAAARTLAALPDHALSALELPEADYAVGWSRGREAFRGKLDRFKGSFYANPVVDRPAGSDRALVDRFPHYMTPNVWPTDPSCAALEPNFKALGRQLNDIGLLLASHCDALIRRALPENHPFSSLHAALRASTFAKGRLLHYYPLHTDSATPIPSADRLWCGYHNDHSILTGLLPSELYHASSLTAHTLDPDSEPRAGLYVHCADGRPRRVSIPPDAVAFQIGEAAQIMSGGLLRATPHAVRMPADGEAALARVAFAVFLQPDPAHSLDMPDGLSEDRVRHALDTSPLVPSLRNGRWCPGDRFVDFAAKTIKAYQS